MEEMAGKVAVVTGGGSGIGEGLVEALSDEGMHVVVADIEEEEAARVARGASAKGVRALAVRTDVADASAVRALADTVFSEFGATHVLCNNAGVLLMGPISDKRLEDWQWVFSVNVFGVVHGLDAFLPRMKAQGGPAHVVNTSSATALGGEGVYGASKAAVFAISQSLRQELEPEGIGVSVLCPAYVNSRILAAQRNRPAVFGARANEPMGTATVTTGLPSISVGRAAVEAIRENRLYVFTLPESMRKRIQPSAEERFEEILAAIERGAEPDAS
jgi:NAD(P)-dependent dehydrogenase (short-subunit alcohol dehydrogenase family)